MLDETRTSENFSAPSFPMFRHPLSPAGSMARRLCNRLFPAGSTEVTSIKSGLIKLNTWRAVNGPQQYEMTKVEVNKQDKLGRK